MLGCARRFVKEESRKKSSCARPGQPERLSLHGLGEDLIVDVRALGGISVSLPGFLHYLHIEVDRQSLRGETLRVVAGLVSQCPAHGMFPRTISVGGSIFNPVAIRNADLGLFELM